MYKTSVYKEKVFNKKPIIIVNLIVFNRLQEFHNLEKL